MTPKYLPLYCMTLIVGTAAFWWFVFPDWPQRAVEDGILAGSVASVITGFFARWF